MKTLTCQLILLVVMASLAHSQAGPTVQGQILYEHWDSSMPVAYWDHSSPNIKAGPYESDYLMGMCGEVISDNYGFYTMYTNYHLSYPPAYVKAAGLNYIWNTPSYGIHSLKSGFHPIQQGVYNVGNT